MAPFFKLNKIVKDWWNKMSLSLFATNGSLSLALKPVKETITFGSVGWSPGALMALQATTSMLVTSDAITPITRSRRLEGTKMTPLLLEPQDLFSGGSLLATGRSCATAAIKKFSPIKFSPIPTSRPGAVDIFVVDGESGFFVDTRYETTNKQVMCNAIVKVLDFLVEFFLALGISVAVIPFAFAAGVNMVVFKATQYFFVNL